MPSRESGLEVRDISVRFGEREVLSHIRLTVDRDVVVLLGPSGCGKSTLLRVIAGLQVPDRGTVWWNGVDITRTPVHRRRFGLMFQDYALFPHRDVHDNIAFGLRMAHAGRAAIDARVRELLALVG